MAPCATRRHRQGYLARLLVVAGCVAATAGGAAADPPTNIHGTVAMAADNPGRFGTYWQTRLWASQEAVDHAVLRLCAGNEAHPAAAAECQQVPVPRGKVVTLENALSGFPLTPPAALYFSWDGIPAEQGVVFTRTFTAAPNGAAGTLGQGAHGQLLTSLPAAGTSQIVPLALDALKFRSNVGIANLGTANNVTVRVRNTQGTVIGEKAYTLPAFAWRQLNDVFLELGIATFSYSFAELVGTAPFAAYASIVDNTSGDPTTMPAKWDVEGAKNHFLPVIARLPGYSGTQWRSDVVAINWQGAEKEIPLLFEAQNRDNYRNPNPWFLVFYEDKALLAWEDVLSSLFSLDNTKGSIVSGGIEDKLLWSRTYNAGGTAGTFGQEFPAIFDDESKIAGDAVGVLIGLSQSTDPASGYRSALGLLNTGYNAATFKVELFDADGNLKGTFTQEVPALSVLQLDKVYQRVTQDAVENGRIKVTATAGQGFAYASIVDNATGDATTEYATIVRTIKKVTGEEYVHAWFDALVIDHPFYLNDAETRCFLNDACGVVGYGDQLLRILYPHTSYTGTEDEFVALYRGLADYDPSNGELWAAMDPGIFDFRNNHGLVCFAIAPKGNRSCMNLPNAHIPSALLIVRSYLVSRVDKLPDHYGGSLLTGPDLAFDPTWRSEDPT